MKYLQLIALSILFACNNKTAPVNSNPIASDTITPLDANTVYTEISTDTSHDEPTLESIVHDFVSKSTDPVHMDSSFTFNDAPYRLKVNYYCLFDSALIVPMQYVEMYGMMEFITNNYAADIKLFKNDDEILDTTISKNDFIKKAKVKDPIKYRLLFQPVINISPESVAVNFSLSVPLTDIGEKVVFPLLKKIPPKK